MRKTLLLVITSLLCGAAGGGAEVQETPGDPQVEVIRLEPAGEHGMAWLAGGEDGKHRLRLVDFSGHRRFIGVQLTSLTPELRAHFGVPEDRGVLVAKVIAETPAESAGVQVGDIVLSADGDAIDHPADLSRVVRGKEEGEEIDLELQRSGETMRVQVGTEKRERMVLDITPGLLEGTRALRHLPAVELPHLDAQHFDELEKTLERLEEYFESDEWRERLEKIEKINVEAVEKRMKEVEQRLLELERQLGEPPR